jgi:transcriptional regulator with XRE-family HTH domain
MSEFELRERLRREFRDPEYRRAYAEDFLDSWIAVQVAVLRRQYNLTQTKLAELCGTKQPGIARLENSAQRTVNLNLLRRVAAAFDLRLRVSFESFGTLLDESEGFGEAALQRPAFAEDPVFWTAPAQDGEHQPPDAISAMREALDAWIAFDAPPARLRDWLSGIDLPAVGYEEEPFRWVVRGLPQGNKRATYVQRMAEAVARLLGEETERLLTTHSDDFLYNLFHLAATLEFPVLLADPLFAMYERVRDDKQQHEGSISASGEASRDCLAPDVLVALTAALVRNQRDQRLRSDWMALIHGGRHGVLPGNLYTGWAGMRRLPATNGSRPDWPAIGEALSVLAGQFGGTDKGRDDFRRLVHELTVLYGTDESVHRQILLGSFASDWPLWAKGLVPKVAVPDASNHVSVYLMSFAGYLMRVTYDESKRVATTETLHEPERSSTDLQQFVNELRHIPEDRSRGFVFNYMRLKLDPLEKTQPPEIARQAKRLHSALLQISPAAGTPPDATPATLHTAHANQH